MKMVVDGKEIIVSDLRDAKEKFGKETHRPMEKIRIHKVEDGVWHIFVKGFRNLNGKIYFWK
jgi:hypothetical protein